MIQPLRIKLMAEKKRGSLKAGTPHLTPQHQIQGPTAAQSCKLSLMQRLKIDRNIKYDYTRRFKSGSRFKHERAQAKEQTMSAEKV